MKNKKTKFISNTILAFLFLGVILVGFFPEPTTQINTSSYSPFYNGNKEKSQVSLMFNVYENAGIVKNIVEILDENEITATFFVGGCWADDNAETLKYLVSHGEEIANHGYFHKDHKTLSYDGNRQEIVNTEIMVEALCGEKTCLFAPPSGSFSKTTLEVAEDLGYKVIMWSKDTIDWRDKDAEKIISRATKDLKNGDLILMHPKPHTVSALEEIIRVIKEKGFSIVKVSSNIAV